jgi:hypothetical protein
MDYTTLEKIVAEFDESFISLTGMKRISALPENFSVFYKASNNPFAEPFAINQEVCFEPVFFKKLKDTTLFAELSLFFTTTEEGDLKVNMCGRFKTNPEGVDYYEPNAYYDMIIDTQTKLHVTDFIEAKLVTDPVMPWEIVTLLENAVIVFKEENPVIFTATSDKVFMKPVENVEDTDIPF